MRWDASGICWPIDLTSPNSQIKKLGHGMGKIVPGVINQPRKTWATHVWPVPVTDRSPGDNGGPHPENTHGIKGTKAGLSAGFSGRTDLETC